MTGATFGQSPYLTTPEAAEYLRFSTPEAFYIWAVRQNVPKLKRGQRCLWDRRDLDAAIHRNKAVA